MSKWIDCFKWCKSNKIKPQKDLLENKDPASHADFLVLKEQINKLEQIMKNQQNHVRRSSINNNESSNHSRKFSITIDRKDVQEVVR